MTSDSTPAYSADTGRDYPSWDALIEAETEGYTVVIILTRGDRTWPSPEGLYPTKQDAENAKKRQQNRFKKMQQSGDHMNLRAEFFVRPLWKDMRERVSGNEGGS